MLKISKKNTRFILQSRRLPIKIDGVLDDSTWAVTEKKTDFFMKFPTDEGKPVSKTFVKLSYDDKFYITISRQKILNKG